MRVAASRWVKADRLHPLIPRETLRWGKLYAGRSAVEREFGRLKNEWALLPLRTGGPWRVFRFTSTCRTLLRPSREREPLAA